MGLPSRFALFNLALAFVTACGGNGSETGPGADVRTPLPDLGSGGGIYKGFMGGLYPGGSNIEPAAHTAGTSKGAEPRPPRYVRHPERWRMDRTKTRRQGQ